MSTNLTTDKQTLGVCVKDYSTKMAFKDLPRTTEESLQTGRLLNGKGIHTESMQHDSTYIDFQDRKN